MTLRKWVQLQGGTTPVAKKLGMTIHGVNIWLRGDGSPKAKTLAVLLKLAKGQLDSYAVIRETRRNM